MITVLFYKFWIILQKLMSVYYFFGKCQHMPENVGLFWKMPVAWTFRINA